MSIQLSATYNMNPHVMTIKKCKYNLKKCLCRDIYAQLNYYSILNLGELLIYTCLCIEN